MERSEAETRQRYTNQIAQLEREITQLKKRVEQELEQRHTVERNQDVSSTLTFLFLCVCVRAYLMDLEYDNLEVSQNLCPC